MMSSVASLRRMNESRISCCLASSRENTVIRAGTPSSPVSRRRTIAWPSDPVPPVTNTFLPSTSIQSSPPVIWRGVGGHLVDHRRPVRRLVRGRGPEPASVQAAIDANGIIRVDPQPAPEGRVQEDQQIVLGNWFRRDVIDTFE